MGKGFKIAYNGEFWVITRVKSKKGENLAKSRK